MADEIKTQARVARAKIPTSVFSTAKLKPEERFEAWRESIGVFLDVRAPASGPVGFEADIEGYLLEDVFLSRCCAGAQKFDRPAIKIARDSIDHYMIQLVLGGQIEMDHRGDQFMIPTGGLVAFDLSEVMDTFNTDFEVLSIIVPRRRLAPLLADPDAQQGARVDPQSGSGKLLANYLVTLFSVSPTLSTAEASLAARSLLDLIALAFNSTALRTGDLPELVQRAELMRVQNLIKERLANADLEPSVVTEICGMSRSQLYRLFAPIGGVAEYIREQRLRRCLADLLSATHAHRQIADIGYRWGFSDPINFAKAFKQRFGRSPSEAREAVLTASNEVRDRMTSQIGDRLYEQWIGNLA
jgi:AraC-like DNA-binding protein